MSASETELQQACAYTLDRLWAAAQRGLVAPAVTALMERTAHWRRVAPHFWRPLVGEVIARHPWSAFVSRCPLTDRARRKPGGYPGDPVVLDCILDRARLAEALQGAERTVFRTVAESPTGASFDWRRQLVAERLAALGRHRGGPVGRPPSVLGLACGHARELDLLCAAPAEAPGRIVVCDQDSDSLAVVRSRCEALGDRLQTRALTARQFLAHVPETRALGQFDLVYCAGLYDDLEQRTATRLTQVLFEHVAPGGALLLSNFHPAHGGAAYLEAFMDWWLVYRDEAEMQDLAADIAPLQIASRQLERDPFGNVLYLTLQRHR